MTTLLLTLIGLLLVLTLVNHQAIAKIFGAGRAQVGKIGRMAEEADPLALLESGR